MYIIADNDTQYVYVGMKEFYIKSWSCLRKIFQNVYGFLRK
jgi:hypothetical protein